MQYKYKLTEMSKTASPDEAEKELGVPKSKFEVGQVTYADNGLTKSDYKCSLTKLSRYR